MPEQTLPDFLYSVITEQRKSIASLVDALNEAKDGISQLSASAERSEESRRQVEMRLERVENDLKFDLTQCQQHNEVLQGQVKTLEENLERTEKLLFVVTGERDGLSESLEGSKAAVTTQHRAILKYRDEIATLKLQLAAATLACVVPAKTSDAENTEAADADLPDDYEVN